MPTFGKTTVGASWNGNGASFTESYKYTLGESGTVTKITGYIRGESAGPQNVRFAIYTDNGSGKPNTLVAVSNEVIIGVSAAAAWVDFTFASNPHLTAGTYHLTIWAGTNNNGSSLAYDTVASSGYWEADTYSSSGNPKNPWTDNNTHSHGGSVYATYTSDSSTQRETFANNAIGNLNAGMASSDTSLTLQSGQGAAFPATGNFRILVESEIMLVVSRAADVLSNITRGLEGTAAIAHPNGAQVTHLITAGALGVFAQGAGVIPVGTSLPSSPSDGDEYILVDSTTAPTYAWHFRYTASITGSYKWVFIGGPPAVVSVETSQTSNSTTYTDLATVGPSFTVPRAGQYLVQCAAAGACNNAGGTEVFVGLKVASAATVDDASARASTATTTDLQSLVGGPTLQTCAVNDLLKMQYKLNAGTGTWTRRRMTVWPFLVS